MIEFPFRVSCVISVPKEELLNHAFHIEVDKGHINETNISPKTSAVLLSGKKLSELFESKIDNYLEEYGLKREEIRIDKFMAFSGHKDVVVSFYNGDREHKLETTDESMWVIAYYQERKGGTYSPELYDYSSKLSNHKYALRVGNEVPEGDVNLAYVHTPRLNVEKNVSIVNTARVSDNVIPSDQLKSIVVSDEEGKLHYAQLSDGKEPILLKPPYNQIPSKDFVLTREFYGDQTSVEQGLYYKFELRYHYDSNAGTPGVVQEYTGTQIMLMDGGNTPLKNSEYKIFAKAMEQNPHIYHVVVYAKVNTDENNTFKIQYNHIDSVTEDVSPQAITGGKVRIFNGQSAYKEVSLQEFQNTGDESEVYIIEQNPNDEGYQVYVPQKSERDPRGHEIFNYKLIAEYTDERGQERSITFGYVTDRVLNPEALMEHEKADYDGEWKLLGIKTEHGFLNAKDLIEMVLPPDVDRLPNDTVYKIEDAKGNLLYQTTSAPDNANVETDVYPLGDKVPRAKMLSAPSEPWGHQLDGVKSNPIPHVCTIFPERQKLQLEFEWEASGHGRIPDIGFHNTSWQACAQVAVEDQSEAEHTTEFQNWVHVGSRTQKRDWEYRAAKDELFLKSNALEVSGLYRNNAEDRKNYIFSTVVRVLDPGDNDIIGVMFRVQSSQQYYMFAWEREQKLNQTYTYPDGRVNYPSRLLIGNKGISEQLYTGNYTEYVSRVGLGHRKKRVYKASPNDGEAYPNDATGCRFDDITLYNGNYNAKGWEVGKAYKITVMVVNNHFRVYISSDPTSASFGSLVCEGQDDTYSSGAYGVFNISQSSAYWSENNWVELDLYTYCTDRFSVSLNINQERRLSDLTVSELLRPVIRDQITSYYGVEFPYHVLSYSVEGGEDLVVRIRNNYVYGYVRSGTKDRDGSAVWRTEDHNKNLKGKGTAILQPDGSIAFDLEPAYLIRNHIPRYVVDFQWDKIWVTSGHEIELSVGEYDRIIAHADTQPIEPIGEPITVSDKILKDEGLKSLIQVVDDGDIYERFNIPRDVPLEDIILRIERGDANGDNKEHRVNYRFRQTQDGTARFVLDQAHGGINRIKLTDVWNNFLPVSFHIDYELLIEKTEATDMKDMFSIPAGATIIEPYEGAATWIIEDGVLKDPVNNTQVFSGAFNEQYNSMTDYRVDYTFTPIGGDDDLIGVLFRVKDKNNFWFMAWECDFINNNLETSSRVKGDQPEDLFKWEYVHRRNYKTYSDYKHYAGWRNNHQRVYKVVNGKKYLVHDKAIEGDEGYQQGERNHIRIENIGTMTKIYVQSGVKREADWNLSFEVYTGEMQGGFGVFNFSKPVAFNSVELQEIDIVRGRMPESGEIQEIGTPYLRVADNTHDFCKPSIEAILKRTGYPGEIKYHPIYFRGVVDGDGSVTVAPDGNGPIIAMSPLNTEKSNANVDLVAWTSFEDLEAVPVMALHILNEQKIAIEKPKVEQYDLEIDNWYLRVKNGRFLRRLTLPYFEEGENVPQLYIAYPALRSYAPERPDEQVEVILEYAIPEYNNQEFFNRPVVFIEQETPVLLSDRMIQTRYAPLDLTHDNIQVTSTRMNHVRQLAIEDIDAAKGIVYLKDRIREQDVITISYAYREDCYTYRGYEIHNPAQDQNVFFHLDLNPSPGHQITVAHNSLHEWLPGDVMTDETYEAREVSSHRLLVRPIHIYLRPREIRLASNNTVIEDTVKPNVIYHTDEDHWFNPRDPAYDPTMLRLGKVSVQENASMEKDMVILDTRTRGGGLDEAITKEIINQVQKESLYNWDIGYFDGEAYQENGVIIVRLPHNILKEHGGRFHESEVQAAIQKHKAYGVLPIVEYYDGISEETEVIGNGEFYDGEHIRQYRPELSRGAYKLFHTMDGTGDNFILELIDDAVYGILVPGHTLREEHYELAVKARLQQGASKRPAAKVVEFYEDGTVSEDWLDPVNQTEWAVYKKFLTIEKPISYIMILVNESNEDINGTMFVDYVLMTPQSSAHEEDMEVVEIK